MLNSCISLASQKPSRCLQRKLSPLRKPMLLSLNHIPAMKTLLNGPTTKARLPILQKMVTPG